MSNPTAQAFKEKGNKAFQEKNYQEAIEHFTKAIEADPNDHVFYSNRSACYASLQNYESALQDAHKCVELKPDWVRGYTRKGLAEYYLGKYSEAAGTYKKGLELDPENAQLKEGLEKAQSHLQNPFAQMFTGENLTKLMTNPKTSGFFQQQDFVNMLNMVQQNPQMAQMVMQDQRFMTCMGVILGFDMEAPPEEQKQPPKEETPKEAPKEAPKKELSEAEKLKNQGNECYKKKKYDEAIQYYDKALELEPNDILYINNKAAVYLAKKDFDKCIELCNEALTKGREVMADFGKIAKAYSRKGLALAEKGLLEEAIQATKDSLMEYSDDRVKFQLKNLEKLKRKKDEEAYVNPEVAEQHNVSANEFFKSGKFKDAINEYTEAIKRNPKNSKYYSNRAAAYIKVMEPAHACEDSAKAIELDPNFVRAYGRKGNAHMIMKEYHKAMDSFSEGLKLDPENAECKDGYARVMNAISSSGDQPDEERLKQAMADPEIQNILRDPQIQQVLKDLQENPQQSQGYLTDPKIRNALNKLMAAGVVKMG